jgi:general secretion pathway protein A
MYQSFYKLKERPFALPPDPDFLFLAPPHRSALTMLEYSLAIQTPFCLITGDIGSGKTTLIRYLLKRIKDPTHVGVISNTNLHFGRLLQWICMSFGLAHTGKEAIELYEIFVRFLNEEYANGHRVVLIVDEAQNLGRARLEELRVLSNINDKRTLLQIILVGQPELRSAIRSPQMLQLAQRIGGDYHLAGLSAIDTRRYIYHRLRVAGGRLSIFTENAIVKIHKASRGIPRLINQYCDLGMLCAAADGLDCINTKFIGQVIEEQHAKQLMAG